MPNGISIAWPWPGAAERCSRRPEEGQRSSSRGCSQRPHPSLRGIDLRGYSGGPTQSARVTDHRRLLPPPRPTHWAKWHSSTRDRMRMHIPDVPREANRLATIYVIVGHSHHSYKLVCITILCHVTRGMIKYSWLLLSWHFFSIPTFWYVKNTLCLIHEHVVSCPVIPGLGLCGTSIWWIMNIGRSRYPSILSVWVAFRAWGQ